MNPPISSLFVLLLILLPAIGLFGRAIASSVSEDRQIRIVLVPAFALAPWLLCVHIVGRWTHSFSTGLGVGTALIAMVGLVVLKQKYARMSANGPLPSRFLWLGAFLAAAILAPTALQWHLHDELNPTGHMSIVAQMLNDVYPPRHNTFPHAELQYHYGFDLFVALFAALTRQRVDHVIDAITIFCWGWSFCLAWVIGDKILQARGPIVAAMVLFAGGMPFLCAERPPITPHELIGHCQIGGVWPSPPIASYFFQHPWTLGIPLALSIVLVLDSQKGRANSWPAALALLLVVLSICQFTLFLSLTPAVVVQAFFLEEPSSNRPMETLIGGRFSPRRGLAVLATASFALLCASQLGGFFTASADRIGPTLLLHLGVTEENGKTFRWMAASFGVVLPLGIVGLYFARRLRLLGFCLMVGSLFVINTLRLKETWDIVKFGAVGMLFLGMFAAVVIDRLVSWDKRILGRPLAVLLLGACTGSGFLYLYLFGTRNSSLQTFFPRNVPPLVDVDANVASFLRARAKPGELVYRAKAMTYPYASWAGLPQVWTEKHAKTFGFSLDRIQRRDRVFTTLPAAAEPYRAENVRWFVLDPKYDAVLINHANTWINNHEATEVMTAGSLRVIELH